MKRWFDRRFVSGVALHGAPARLDRPAGPPDRAAVALAVAADPVRVHKPDGRWSIQEQAGHAADREARGPLRFDDFERGVPILHAADLQNRRTHEALPSRRQPRDLIGAFRSARTGIVPRLAAMLRRRWPWCRTIRGRIAPMPVVDLYFMDDCVRHLEHHLRQIRDHVTA